ncbi:MAG: acetyltransferase [Pseudomonadales bacterium]
MHTLRGIAVLLLISASTIVLCAPLYLIGLLRFVSPASLRRRMNRTMDAIVQFWVGGNRAIFALLGVTRVNECWKGEAELSTERWYLVISNHQSWADILILQNLFRGRVPTLKFFTKRELIWVPLIGVAMWFLGFPYVRRLSRERITADPSLARLDREAALDACRGFRDHPSTVLAFLEGTRFTAAKRAAQQPRFAHLLNPKLGGVSYVVTALHDRLHKVLDVTLVYPDGVPTFWELICGHCPQVDISVDVRDLPESALQSDDSDLVRERLRPWVETLWQTKDRFLDGEGNRHGDGLAN